MTKTCAERVDRQPKIAPIFKYFEIIRQGLGLRKSLCKRSLNHLAVTSIDLQLNLFKGCE